MKINKYVSYKWPIPWGCVELCTKSKIKKKMIIIIRNIRIGSQNLQENLDTMFQNSLYHFSRYGEISNLVKMLTPYLKTYLQSTLRHFGNVCKEMSILSSKTCSHSVWRHLYVYMLGLYSVYFGPPLLGCDRSEKYTVRPFTESRGLELLGCFYWIKYLQRELQNHP